MEKNNWQDAGDQIKNLVQDAIDSQDFSQLGNTIANVVNDTINELQASLRTNLGGRPLDPEQLYRATNREAADRIRKNLQEKGSQIVENKLNSTQLIVPGEIPGNVMKWFGYSVGGCCGLAAAILGVVGLTTSIPIALPLGVLGVVFAGTVALGYNGSQKVKLAKRFRRYRAVLGPRTHCRIEELASAVGQSTKNVTKDLRKMISGGFFKEGYLDSQETILITDKETYQQYLETQTEYERRMRMENRKTAEAWASGNTTEQDEEDLSKLPPECREIVESGRKYIRHIHECNDRIPGEEITAKLNRLEMVVTRIFKEVVKNPASAGDLKKMMNYYLPTTTKLLDAYCELDAQPVSGQNIDTTKKEIESALDTINEAFENLLDNMFQDSAWDISSDITVLNTMLAQEGLTGSDFK